MAEALLDSIDDLLAAAGVPGEEGPPSGETQLRTRIGHLLAELDALKQSHAEAVSAAIAEREQRLREQQEHLHQIQTVMMMAADGIVTVDDEGRIESFNEQAGVMFGYAPREVIGQNIAILQSPDDPRGGGPALAECMLRRQAGCHYFGYELQGRRKDGGVFPLEMSVSEVRLGGRRIFSGIFRDITKRRILETQLRQAQKLESIGQLAAGIAHEINTPTQYIGDNVRFLDDAFRDLAGLWEKCLRLGEAAARGEPLPGLAAELAEAARQADAEYLIREIPKAIQQSLEGVQRVAAIVRSMKEFSHPGGDEKQAVDFNRAIESTLTVSRNEWKYVAEMETRLDPDLPLVTCLAGDCNQVILNLIVNAAHAIGEKIGKAAGEKGKITITTRRNGPWVEIRIADTGTGIPERIRGRIFDPFFTTKPVGQGTGQGLAIAHSIITEKHGGQIDFETEVGRGTTFIVRLPIEPKPEPRGDGRR